MIDRTGTAFGLCVHDERSREAAPTAATGCGSRCVTIQQASADAAYAGWHEGSSSRAVEIRGAEDALELAVDVHPDLGYRLSGDGEPAYLVSRDGSMIRCVAGAAPPTGEQRLLSGQALPLAALLQGVEVLHASAVAVGGHAIAFSGPSGAGKTSLAVRLAVRGHGFVTDDVLAVEPAGAGLLAHPGPGLAHLRPDVLRALEREDRPGRPRRRPGPDGATVEIAAEREPLPLATLYLLRRAAGETALRRLDAPDPRVLLGTSFNFLDRRHERLAAHLDVCARLARSVRVVELTSAPGADLDAIAELVERDAAAPSEAV